MRHLRRFLRRKPSVGCLLKYVGLCCIVSCLLAVTCHIALNSKWRPLVLYFSSATTSQTVFIDWGRKIESLRRPQKIQQSWSDRLEAARTAKPHDIVVNPGRNKWQITFITDDSNDRQVEIKKTIGQTLKVHEKHDRVMINSTVLTKTFHRTAGTKRLTERIHYFNHSYKFVGDPLSPDSPADNRTPKVILLWTTFFGKRNWLPEDRLNCSYSGLLNLQQSPPCRISYSRADLSKSDLIIMHANDIESSSDLPKTRSVNQRWLFYCQESPKHMYLELDNFTSLFNYTALMRKDSDYVLRHGGVIPKVKPMRKTKFVKHLARIIASKKHLVAARISNCGPKERLKYIEALQQFVRVDFYGTCGDKSCPKFKDECNGSRMAAYKFYLAFENSNCRDYITEKFWLPLHHWNSVPVVMGGASREDYKRVAPPHSYINVADFASPRQLGEYLQLLDKNQTLYEQYFHWRRFYGNRRQRDDTWCRMCADLHNASKPVQYYTDLKTWYHQDACVS